MASQSDSTASEKCQPCPCYRCGHCPCACAGEHTCPCPENLALLDRMREAALRQELEERRACLVGAKQTLESVAATLENAQSLDLARLSLQVPVRERIALVEQAIENTDNALGVGS